MENFSVVFHRVGPPRIRPRRAFGQVDPLLLPVLTDTLWGSVLLDRELVLQLVDRVQEAAKPTDVELELLEVGPQLLAACWCVAGCESYSLCGVVDVFLDG